MNQCGPVRSAGGVFLRLLRVLWVVSALFISSTSAIGVNFGQVANNLPSNAVTLQLVKTTTISKLKIYSADPEVLTTFAGSGIDMIVGTTNDEIQPMATTDGYALSWVQSNIAAFPQTSIVGIALGNEVLSYEPQLIPFLLPALQNLQAALVSLGLDKTVKVSTPNSLGIVEQSFPPSYGEFYNGNTISPLLEFFAETGAPFMVNIYPYFAYEMAPQNISLDYVLFGPNTVSVYDSGSGLNYTNMFDAQVDAVYAAMSKLGFENVSLTVTETGWPSAGDPNQAGATVANAQIYNANLVKHIESGVGTPAKPGVTVDTLIFALYNENLKPGPTSERNFGLYTPDGTPMYNAGLTVSPQWYNPPPPTVALPPASPPPPSFFTPPPTTAASPGVYWPPPVLYAPPPAVYGQPPPIPSPPTVLPAPVAPQPPPLFQWSPPPPAVWAPPPPVSVTPQPPPVGWSPPPPVVLPPSPPVSVAPQPPPEGWSPPPVVLPPSPPAPVEPQPPPTGLANPPVEPPPSPVTSPPLGPSLPLSPPAPPVAIPPTIVPVAPGPAAPGPAGSPTNSTPSWCVAKADADAGQLQIALDWACSTGGAECSVLQTGGVCAIPNTLVAHASYAFDSYYSLNTRNSWDCFFSDTAVVTTVNPSFPGCTFP